MDLISKKELLACTGISYGQLYRWKRERLIPEEWFIKQASYTGQETFFSREQVLERVHSILDMKDAHSLEELANILASEDTMTFPLEKIRKLPGIDVSPFEALSEIPDKTDFSLGELSFAWSLGMSAEKAGMNASQTRSLIREGLPALSLLAPALALADTLCTLFSAGNSYHVSFTKMGTPLVFDGGLTTRAVLPLGETANFLKTILAEA